MSDYKVSIQELLDLLGLEYTSNHNLRSCPFCGARNKLHFNPDKDIWICPKCKSSGGVLSFYARYKHGLEKLPESSAEKGKLAKELRSFAGVIENDPQGQTQHIPCKNPPKSKFREIRLAPDSHLHAVHTAMLELPYFALSETHKKKLLKRGLTEEAIARNQYRSVPDSLVNPAPYIELYEKEGGDVTKLAIFEKWQYPTKYIQIGLSIATALLDRGLELKGVPGFYKFGKSWCYWINPGILIPTRNLKGEIVVFQVRRDISDRNDAKYITSHCSKLPGAVNESVSRCHFPLGNATPGPKVTFMFTEGPLKADVALCLYGKPAIFAAVPGIDTTKDFLSYVQDLKDAGISTMINAFDMDKLTNPNVRSGSQELMHQLRMQGIKVKQFYWGEKYARYKLTSLLQIAKIRHVNIKNLPGANVYDLLQSVAVALEQANIFPCQFAINRRGDKVSYYWEPETKGIDDYLLSIR